MRIDEKLDPPGGPILNVFQTFCGGLDAAGQRFEPWMKATARSNFEVMSLMSRRAQAYMNLPARMTQCRTPQDFVAEQTQFWQTMAQHYAECSQRLMATWASVLQANGGAGAAGRQRDYISFPEPQEDAAAQPSRPRPGERRAA